MTNTDLELKKRQRQRYTPFIMMIIAAIILGLGVVFGILWFSGATSDFSFVRTKATSTSTSTVTPVVAMTWVPSATPSPTLIPSITPTFGPSPTALVPFPYVVQDGDTVYTLAEKFGLDPDTGYLDIMWTNSMGGSTYLAVGEEILIPDPNTRRPTATPLPADTVPGTLINYTVLPGDLLSLIADEFYSSVDDILTQNNIADADYIQPGDVLQIPVFSAGTPAPDQPTATPQPTLGPKADPNATATPLPADLPIGTIVQYTVQQGDYLSTIADEFYTTVDEIKTINELDDASYIFVGQVLDIPVYTAGRPE